MKGLRFIRAFALLAAMSAADHSLGARLLNRFSSSLETLASSSDAILLARVPAARGATADGLLTLEVEETWKGAVATEVRVVAAAPWMAETWSPQPRERVLVFLSCHGPNQPCQVLDAGAVHFHVEAGATPAVEVWPGLLPSTLLNAPSCRRVPTLNPDGTITYKRICTSATTVNLSTLRSVVANTIGRTSGAHVLPVSIRGRSVTFGS